MDIPTEGSDRKSDVEKKKKQLCCCNQSNVDVSGLEMSLIHCSPGTRFSRKAEDNANNYSAMTSGSGNLVIYRIYYLNECFLNLQATK